jgi:tetratricopeptide (TPR) repeat protein
MKIPLITMFCIGFSFWPLFSQSAGRQNSSQSLSFPSLEPDPRATELAGRSSSGDYRWRDLLDIALWASGAENSSGGAAGGQNASGRYRERIITAVEELGNAGDLPENIKERGEYVLSFMHRKFLKSYSLNQTRLDEIITTGRFNCVSSAVLYAILGKSVGLDVRGVITKDHAFATVRTGNERIDVETTNAYGFDPGNRKDFHDDFGKLTGFAYVPAGNYRNRTAISVLELTSLILSNRIAGLEKRNSYSASVSLAINRAALLANRRNAVSSPFFDDGEKEVTDRFLNYGSSLLNAGKEADALAWAAYASAKYPADGGAEARWRGFIQAALNNYSIKLIKAGKTAAARETLEQYAGRINSAQYAELDRQILDAELLQRVNNTGKTEQVETVLNAIDEAGRASRLTPSRTAELRVYVILKESERINAAEGPLAAITYTEGAIARHGKNSRLDEALRVYRQNRIADMHNRFALLYNSKDFAAAHEHIRLALREYPGNRQLQQDLRLAERALGTR